MHKENIYEPFEIVFKELNECPKKAHEHNFFELVYIVSGTGQQCINKNKFPYHKGHLFLITPDDCHSFEIDETTQFLFIRFNNIYIKNSALQPDNIQKLEFILQHANHQPGCILTNQVDKTLVEPIINALIREYVNRDLYNKELIRQLVNTLIIIVARNIAKTLPEKINEQSEEKAMDILQYIQSNIYNPERLTAEHLGITFGISESYLGRYFKKHANETLQDYLMQYKLKLIENRLLHSDMRIGEIAREFGFTDDSHLNRIFKKHRSASPSHFRKAHRVIV
ncbi:AraC family transcriptional regulator [Pedobacter antarcticus]|uniref:AraC family transcriptional regulator n=1 Tax=Pedobacter antarcticus TaxID=34086 RepID=UPI00292FD8D2|nr:AraC family transcriptional regulator [Pedobacter antarcticus]